MHNIIQNLNHWVVGWTDWNLVLDMLGGPNWANNNVDAPIIVNPEEGEFYKQPMYYALGHISKFIVPGSVRIDLQKDTIKVEAVAVKVNDSSNTPVFAVVILNR